MAKPKKHKTVDLIHELEKSKQKLFEAGEDAKIIALVGEAAERLDLYSKILSHAFPDKSGAYFICGGSDQLEEDGLPHHIFVCPAYGADPNTTQIYEKVKVNYGKSKR